MPDLSRIFRNRGWVVYFAQYHTSTVMAKKGNIHIHYIATRDYCVVINPDSVKPFIKKYLKGLFDVEKFAINPLLKAEREEVVCIQ